ERHLPLPAQNASYDFVALPPEPATERPSTPEQRVLITAADQRVVDVALRLAEDARLRPLSLTVAAHNLPTLARLPRDSHVAWVHCAAGPPEPRSLSAAPPGSARALRAPAHGSAAAERTPSSPPPR